MEAVPVKVWMLAEAFTLTQDHTTIHDSLTVWATPYTDRNACLRALKKAVKDRIAEYWEGADDEGWEKDDVKETLSGYTKPNRESRRYVFSKDDREIVWRVYPCEVEPARTVKGRKAR